MTPDQLRLLAELSDWQIIAIADAPDFWCKHIREGHGCGSAKDSQWGEAGLGRKTYPWGIAMTDIGDYLSERKVSDPAHAVTLTWRQITRWAESLPAELRAAARRAHKAEPHEQRDVVELLLAPAETETEEMTLW